MNFYSARSIAIFDLPFGDFLATSFFLFLGPFFFVFAAGLCATRRRHRTCQPRPSAFCGQSTKERNRCSKKETSRPSNSFVASIVAGGADER